MHVRAPTLLFSSYPLALSKAPTHPFPDLISCLSLFFFFVCVCGLSGSSSSPTEGLPPFYLGNCRHIRDDPPPSLSFSAVSLTTVLLCLVARLVVFLATLVCAQQTILRRRKMMAEEVVQPRHCRSRGTPTVIIAASHHSPAQTFTKSPQQQQLLHSLPSPPAISAASAIAAPRSKLAACDGDGSFFESFRNSFRSRTTTTSTAAAAHTAAAAVAPAAAQQYVKMLRDLEVWEQELRQQLLRHESEELTELTHSVERVLLPLIPALRDVSPLDLVQQELVGRWSIVDDYFQLLLDATELQEMLHRRALCATEEPQQRTRITDSELQHWIEARCVQVMRENQEWAATQSEEQVQRVAYFRHVQQHRCQVFLLEERERADRMEVERLQRLHVGGLAEVIAKEYRRVRLCQLRYEAARLPLRPSLSYEIAAEEGLHRSMLAQEQARAFKHIQAAEVRDYLVRVR
jgi:hypothetical protein